MVSSYRLSSTSRALGTTGRPVMPVVGLRLVISEDEGEGRCRAEGREGLAKRRMEADARWDEGTMGREREEVRSGALHDRALRGASERTRRDMARRQRRGWVG